MSNIQNLIVLDKTKIEKRIVRLGKPTGYKQTDYENSWIVRELTLLLEQSKPLEPIVSEQIILGQLAALDRAKDLDIQTVYNELKAKLK